jgi:hypothetical protein
MKFYNIIIKYRFYLSILALILAVVVNITAGFWASFILYFLALIGFASHFFIGPLRLIQEPMEQGNMEEVQRIMATIWFPNLLYKPIRSTYYTLKGNLAMMNQDFDSAEKHMKKSLDLGSPMAEAEGANKLQLGMMALQKGDMKTGESYVRQAIRAAIPIFSGCAINASHVTTANAVHALLFVCFTIRPSVSVDQPQTKFTPQRAAVIGLMVAIVTSSPPAMRFLRLPSRNPTTARTR